MKKLLVIAIASLSLIAAANANVAINLDASTLLQGGSGSAASLSSTLALLVIDNAGNGLTTADLSTGISLALGGIIGGDDIIVARFDMSVGGDGYVSGTTSFTATAGKVLGIYWFNGNTISDTLLTGAGNKYGSAINPSPIAGDAWAVPADGNLSSLVLSTPDDAESLGYATGNIVGVPEPSTYMLVGTGLLGLLAIRRRRS